MRAGLSIGDFSQITHLSVKTLRRYHEAGLLQPAEVNPYFLSITLSCPAAFG
jgi:hypothetical protein